jgi:acetyltransferase, GNAT family
VTDWEAVTERLLLRAACRKCGRPAPIAETERLFLRELSMKDLPALGQFELSERESRFLGGDWEGLKEAAFLRRYIETQYAFFDYGLWALFRRTREAREAQFLGLVGFSPAEPPELGYALRREQRGQGYATEAGLAALRYAAEELGLRKAQIRVAPENRAGLAAAEKIKEQWNRAGGAPQCRLFIQR